MADVLDLDAYDGKLIGLSESASIELDDLIERSRGIEDLTLRREYIQSEIPRIAGRLERAAASVASDSYDEWRTEVLGGAFNGAVNDSDLEPVIASARSLSHPLKDVSEGSLTLKEAEARMKTRLSSMLDRRIKSKARYTMQELSRQDDKSIGCASIPQGATTCAFCLEMAAVGFAYSFKVLNMEGRTFHDHCDCRFIPGFIGHSVKTIIDGKEYDSDKVREALDDVKATLGYSSNVTLTNKVLNEMRQEVERRDLGWMMWGEEPETIYQIPRETCLTDNNLRRDIFAHDALRRHGIWATVRQANAPDGYSNIDLDILEGRCEIKSPTGNNMRAVESNLRDAKRQFFNQYDAPPTPIRIVFNSRYMEVDDDKIAGRIILEIVRHDIDEVLQVLKDGSIRRYYK